MCDLKDRYSVVPKCPECHSPLVQDERYWLCRRCGYVKVK